MAKKATAFDEMSTEALLCRSLGHAWTITLISRKRYDGGVWEVALECLRCKTTRDDVVPAGTDPKTPFNLARTYGYANAYIVADLKSWGGPSLLKRNARDVLFRRLRKDGT
jgi:hypothetical protein